MNIAILSTGFLGKKEATVITITDFAKELIKQKNTVLIISEKRAEQTRLDQFEGIPIYRIGFSNYLSKFKLLFLYDKILAHVLAIKKMNRKLGVRFEIIHNFSAAPLLCLRLILLKLIYRKAKTVQTLKSYSRELAGGSGYRLLNFVDVITVPTTVFANKLISRGVKKEKIVVIRSNINTEKFFYQNRTSFKKKYGFEHKKIVLYYGSMWKNKGTEILISSIPLVIKNNPDIIFLFIPRNMPYARRYESSLNGFGDSVKFITAEINLPEYVSMADVVVLPYLTLIGTEGNPSCLLEAMACKTPVITSDLPELREIAESCVDFVAPGDVNSLALTINNVLMNQNAEQLEKAYLKAQQFSVEKISAEFLKLYNAISKDL